MKYLTKLCDRFGLLQSELDYHFLRASMVLIRSDEYHTAMMTMMASGNKAMNTLVRILQFARRPKPVILPGNRWHSLLN